MRGRWFLCFAGLAAVTIVFAAVTGAQVAQGWLAGFVLASMVPIGSLAALLVHGISDGRWGRELEPVLAPAARATPVLIAAFLPVIVFRGHIYKWSALDLPVDVLRAYLNPVFFDARTLAALCVWSVLAWTAAWRRPLTAGLGLVAHLILVSLVLPDWVLTLEPGSTSAGFGFGFGIEQVFAAFGFCALIAQQTAGRPTRDLAGMLVSALLGVVYFDFMQFIITWYGNIPAKVHWYAQRKDSAWPLLAFLAFAIGAAIPFLAALNGRVRSEPALLRIVGALVLAGIALHVFWLTVPAFGPAAIPFAVLSLATIAAALMSTARRKSDRPMGEAHA